MRAPALTFCRGTPDAVREEAIKLYAEAKPGTHHAHRIERLASDDRMTGVWQKLKSRNADALADVFRAACTENLKRTHSIKLARRTAASNFAQAARLRRDADLLREYNEAAPREFWSDVELQCLRDAADIYDCLADRAHWPPFVVKRYKKIQDPQARDLALVLSGIVKSLFGDPLDITVADIASVALDRTVDERTVKFWRTDS